MLVSQVVFGQQLGATRRIQSVARALVRIGHEVTVVAPGRELDTPPSIRRVRPPGVLKPGARMEAALASIAFTEALRAKTDGALVRLSATTSFCPLLLSTRIPVVVELDGRVLDQLRASGRDEASIRLVRESLSAVVKRSKGVLALGERAAEHARRFLGAQDVRVIHDGVDLDQLTPGDRGDARARLGIDEDVTVVTLTGKLEDLELMPLFQAQRALGFTLLVAGQGPDERAIVAESKRAGAPPIIVRSVRSRGESVDEIRAANVCLNVRRFDLGAAADYAAVGRRFVSFATGANRLDNAYPKGLAAAFFVDTHEAEGLVEAITAAFRAERELGTLAPEHVDLARESLGWTHTAMVISDAFERACARRRPGARTAG